MSISDKATHRALVASLRRDEAWSDLRVVCDDGVEVPAHAVVLFSYSDALLSSEGGAEDELRVPFSSGAVEAALAWVYAGDATALDAVPPGGAAELAGLAARWGLTELADRVAQRFGEGRRLPRGQRGVRQRQLRLCGRSLATALLDDSSAVRVSPALLALHSPFFAAMFSGRWRERGGAVARVGAVPQAAFRAAADFCHYGEVRAPPASLAGTLELLDVAAYLQMPALEAAAERYAFERFAAADPGRYLVRLWNFAGEAQPAGGREHLRELCRRFGEVRFEAVAAHPSFLALHEECVMALLRPGRVEAGAELVVAALRRWARARSAATGEGVDGIMARLLPPATLFCLANRAAVLDRGDRLVAGAIRGMMMGV